MSKLWKFALVLMATIAVAACASNTVDENTAFTPPATDVATPEPDISSSSTIETAQTDQAPGIPEFVPTQPVQSLGASSSGLGR